MQNSYRNLSDWREQTVTVKAGVTDVDFIDTTPNMFIMQNTHDKTLYVGISKVPTDTNYEFSVGKHSNAVFGRPYPTRKLFIYNPSGVEMDVKIFSIYDEFDMNILNQVQVSVEGAEISTDGIVKGFADNVHLPSGDNVIGQVKIANGQLDAVTERQDSFISKFDGYAAKLLSEDLVAGYTNLKSLLAVLTDVGEGIANLANQLLTTNTSISVTGAVISDGANAATFNTNNWFQYWQPSGKGCFKVSDFAADTECEIQAVGSYAGVSEQKNIVAYFKLDVTNDDRIKVTCSNSTEGYPTVEYLLESINDPNNVKYLHSDELLWTLCRYLFTIYPPTVTPEPLTGFRGVNFNTSQQAYTYEETSSQVYNQYSGALANLQKQVNVISEFNGIYNITDATGVNICSPLTTETSPIKIYDHVEFISNMSDYDMTIKLYYTFADYVEVLLPAKDYISDINMPLYNIGVKADTTTFENVKMSLYGGMY